MNEIEKIHKGVLEIMKKQQEYKTPEEQRAFMDGVLYQQTKQIIEMGKNDLQQK